MYPWNILFDHNILKLDFLLFFHKSLDHGDFLLKMPNFGLKMDFWVYESSLCMKRSSKIEFWNKIGSERKVIFKRILNSCACLPWVDAGHNVPRSSDIFITFVFSFYSSFVSRNIILKTIKKITKMGIIGQKLGFLGTEKFSWWCHDCIIKRMKTTVRYFGVLVLLTKVKNEYFWYRSKFSRTKNWTTLLWPSSFLFTPWLTTRGLRSTAIDHGLSTISPRTGLQWTLHLNFNNWKKPRDFEKNGVFD